MFGEKKERGCAIDVVEGHAENKFTGLKSTEQNLPASLITISYGII